MFVSRTLECDNGKFPLEDAAGPFESYLFAEAVAVREGRRAAPRLGSAGPCILQELATAPR
jgi:hypothetical protein